MISRQTLVKRTYVHRLSINLCSQDLQVIIQSGDADVCYAICISFMDMTAIEPVTASAFLADPLLHLQLLDEAATEAQQQLLSTHRQASVRLSSFDSNVHALHLCARVLRMLCSLQALIITISRIEMICGIQGNRSNSLGEASGACSDGRCALGVQRYQSNQLGRSAILSLPPLPLRGWYRIASDCGAAAHNAACIYMQEVQIQVC